MASSSTKTSQNAKFVTFSRQVRKNGNCFVPNASKWPPFRPKCVKMGTFSPKMRQHGHFFAQNASKWRLFRPECVKMARFSANINVFASAWGSRKQVFGVKMHRLDLQKCDPHSSRKHFLKKRGTNIASGVKRVQKGGSWHM